MARLCNDYSMLLVKKATHILLSLFAVTGNANYCMERTALTVGGFTQPNVAKALIENSSSVEKGLTQRFLCLFLTPSYVKFETLETIEEQFSDYLGNTSIFPTL